MKSIYTPGHNARRCIQIALVLLLAVLLFGPAGTGAPASAAEADGFDVCDRASATTAAAQLAMVIELRCDFSGNGTTGDALTIYDRAGRDLADAAWFDPARMEDSTWIFDAGADSQADLIIDFRPGTEQLVARLYQSNGSGGVDYNVMEGDVAVSPSFMPAVTVSALDGWWIRGDRVNFNLDIEVDGGIRAGFSEPDETRSTDGQPDYVIEIRDYDGDGLPDSDWRTVQGVPRDDASAAFRSYLMVNETGNEPPLEPLFPWPYLGPLTYGYLTSSARETSQPPLQVDWSTASIAAVGEFVSSRGNDGQWFVYSYNPIVEGGTSQPNFEAPFAWYDMARDGDGQPELAVRFGYFPMDDTTFRGGRARGPVNFVRYSWDQDNDGHWDYKVGLLGSHAVEDTVDVGDLSLEMVPYEDIPGWVVGREWPVVTFAAAAEVDATGEGIYDWDPSQAMESSYFLGSDPAAVDESMRVGHEFGSLHPGYRGEYHFEHLGPISLYVSPVDRQLHLTGATRGVWNKLAGSTVRYSDRNGDGYVDDWLHVHTDASEEQLSLVDHHLVYSGSGRVIISSLSDPNPPLTTAPPATPEEWTALGEQVAAIAGDQPPQSMRQMIDQFDSELVVMTNVTARAVRETPTGYRFVLDVLPDHVRGSLSLPGIDGPGSYVVEYNSETDTFTVVPSTPSVPEVLSISSLSVDAALQPGDMQVHLQNTGTEDIPPSHLWVYAMAPSGNIYDIYDQPLTLHAEEDLTVTFNWSPPFATEWEVFAEVTEPDLTTLAVHSIELDISDPPLPALQKVIRAGWPSANAISYVLLLLGAVGLVTTATVVASARRA